MELDIYQIDAFTSKIFSGNPAAVIPLKEWLEDETLIKIAAENNLSETAFFIKQENAFHLRWFTPYYEVDLCGHATLATAYVLFNLLKFNKQYIKFLSRSGDLFVHKTDDGLMMDFPTWSYTEIPVTEEITNALGKKPKALFKSKKLIALFDDEETVQNLEPNFELIKNIKDTNGILPTALGNSVDFVSRNFAPQLGIPEDPVTGSAHCALTPFWAERLNKTKLHAKQLSKRGGDLICELTQHEKTQRVEITGQAALYMTGVIHV